MEISMKEVGKMIKLKDMEYSLISIVQSMKVTG
jgi:hypothetical protein